MVSDFASRYLSSVRSFFISIVTPHNCPLTERTAHKSQCPFSEEKRRGVSEYRGRSLAPINEQHHISIAECARIIYQNFLGHDKYGYGASIPPSLKKKVRLNATVAHNRRTIINDSRKILPSLISYDYVVFASADVKSINIRLGRRGTHIISALAQY